ncbi:MAG TPA: hypothetical protein VFS09_09805 [Candidatus Eisenbacteria bacterium]|nr:hypothetical protein [Candidatus Eisenbacteria bacterium]
MPINYRIDAPREIVIVVGAGILTAEEIRKEQAQMNRETDLAPHFNQLIDLKEVTELRLSVEDVRQLSYGSPFREGSRRVIVVDRPEDYGLARVFQALTEPHGAELRVSYDLAEALRWLGMEP